MRRQGRARGRGAPGHFLAGLGFALALPVGAAAAPTAYTLITHAASVKRSAGPDRLVGTADDVVLPLLPGPDGSPGTADDIAVNPSGSVSYLRLEALPLGGDYEVFFPGTLTVDAWVDVTAAQQATAFSLAGPATTTSGLVGTLSDGSTSPHFLRLADDAAASAILPLRFCASGSCTDVSVAYLGGVISNRAGHDDPSLVPGLTTSQAAYLAFLETLAPPDWTQIWLLVAPPSVLDAADVSGDAAPFLVGGQASSVLAFYTTDPAVLGDDADGDGVPDSTDNCPFAANPDQSDRGGIGATSAADGIGDACQCGDVSGDGRVSLSDAILVSRSLLKPPLATLARPALCDVTGVPGTSGATCTLADAVALRRALLAPPTANIAQQCAPAVSPAP